MDNELKKALIRLEVKLKNVEYLLKNHLKHHWEFSLALLAIVGGLLCSILFVLVR